MITLSQQKQVAIQLRKQGKTYSEILAVVPVAKSTLSLWLRSVGLSKAQTQRITKKRCDAQKRGAQARKQQRLDSTRNILTSAKQEIGALSPRERLLIGATLYWAEGAKEHEGTTVSQPVDFGNTDAAMLRCFIAFLREALHVPARDLVFSLYIHKNHAQRIVPVKQHWSKVLGIPNLKISWVYYKKHNPKTVRTNIGESYFGTLRVYARNSSALQRKISGWIYGIKDADWDIV